MNETLYEGKVLSLSSLRVMLTLVLLVGDFVQFPSIPTAVRDFFLFKIINGCWICVKGLTSIEMITQLFVFSL